MQSIAIGYSSNKLSIPLLHTGNGHNGWKHSIFYTQIMSIFGMCHRYANCNLYGWRAHVQHQCIDHTKQTSTHEFKIASFELRKWFMYASDGEKKKRGGGGGGLSIAHSIRSESINSYSWLAIGIYTKAQSKQYVLISKYTHHKFTYSFLCVCVCVVCIFRFSRWHW